VLVEIPAHSNHDPALTRQVPSRRQQEEAISRIWAAINADDDATAAGVESPICQDGDRGSAGRYPDEWAGSWPDDELAACRQKAEEGDVPSARRVAELLELKGRDTEAVAWWHRAADAGDRDAIFYLEARDTTS
jgi:hypothetical protein